ncbi:MAG: efflux RND transporter permease subunit [Acidobacteria bacterium]|nr:efflux RND transporter permease subunit [Candidatus Sulfomarinibacter kjeldsenii]
MDFLIRRVLSNRLLVMVVAAFFMGAGILSYLRLPVDAFPDVSPNLVQVFTLTEGLAPEEVETYVTFPVEVAMNGLPGVAEVRSVSNFGLSVVNVYFADEVDVYFARQLVGERLQEAREQIPEGFGEPQMGPISTGMGQILFYYLEDTTGRYSLEELRTIQDWLIKHQLQTVPGVTEVLGIGGWEKQFQVVVEPTSLLRYDVSLADVIAAIRANNLNVGAQFLERNSEELVVRSVGLATGISDLNRVVIKTVDGTPVFLRDLADVRIGGAIRRGVQTHDGVGEVVAGQVIKLFGANSSTVIGAVEEKLAEVNGTLPAGVRIVPYYQQKSLVEAAVGTVTSALLIGIGLVVLVLPFFMGGVRPSLVVALAIPFSVLTAFVGMRLFGISANLMSFGGLAIAIGMMVDGTIVMVENIERLLREASPEGTRLEIVAKASVEVARPIFFAILIIIVVFLPLFTLQGVEGKTFRPLAATVSMAMLGSLIYALLVSPVMAWLLMRRKRGGEPNLGQRVVTGLQRAYEPLLRSLVGRPAVSVSLAVALLVVGAVILPQLGSEFTPTLQEGTLILRLTMAPSIALSESTEVALRVERRLMTLPEVVSVVTRIGRGEVGAHTDPVNNAEMFLLLEPKNKWRVSSQEELEALIREHLGEIPGVLTSFTQPIQMSIEELLEGVRAELAIKLFGEDLEALKAKADEIASVVAEVRGAADVQADQIAGTPQLLIRVDRGAVARWGLNVEDVQAVVRAAVGGESAGQIFEGVRRFEIVVRYPQSSRDTPEAIGSILVPTPDGATVPIAQLAVVEEVVGPRQITRENGQRFITVQCNVADRDIGSFVAEAQRAIDDEVDLPPGYLVTWGGQFELQQKANRRLALVVPVTLVLIFLLLYASFNSLRSSALILLNIPLALVGGVAALWISGQNLSVPASVGFIALFGIALENGMVLVTYLNQLVEDHTPVGEASIRGALLRLRPVLMTAMTTALGLVPLLLSSGTGSEVQRPLATVVIGGLVTSTVLTLLVLPAIYRWFAPAPNGGSGR